MILDHIIETKKEEVAFLKETKPLGEVVRMIRDLPPTRDFRGALAGPSCAIIAEIKRRSPSKGQLRENVDPVRLASIYEANGAAAVSILTDRDFFAGEAGDLEAVREASRIPLLRKDFIIDPYQVYESRLIGADALLLIARLFGEKELKAFLDLAESLDLAALVEIHTHDEVRKAVAAGAGIIGINNRDLATFKTDIRTSIELAPRIPADRIAVSESGIETRADVEKLMDAGLHAFLVGETLMRAGDAGEKLRELKGS